MLVNICTHKIYQIGIRIFISPQPPERLDSTRMQAVLDGEPTFKAICSRLRNGTIRRVVVLCGAGISVNAGIPDFRTKGTGLVNLSHY